MCYFSREGSDVGINMYLKHVSMTLTLVLTLNDINKPINGFITPNVANKWCHLSPYVKRVKVIFWWPMTAIVVSIVVCFTSNYKQNNIIVDCRDEIQLKNWCNFLFCIKVTILWWKTAILATILDFSVSSMIHSCYRHDMHHICPNYVEYIDK